MKVKHKKTNQILSCRYYDCWILKIVNEGKAHEFDILEYPDIVQLIFIQPTGNAVNDKILDRKEAIKLISKYPSSYDYAEIDINYQLIKDIEKSNTNGTKKNKSKHKIVSDKILYFLSFILLVPLFSKKVRIAVKKYIDVNSNVIQTIAVIVLILLTLYMVYLMKMDITM